MPARNVNLTDHFDRLNDARDDSGRFSNASEVVRAGLELRDLEDKLKWWRSAVNECIEDMEQGRYTT